MKEHSTVIFQTSTTECLQREAQAEAQLRRKPLTQKNVSFEITGKYKSIQSTEKDTPVRYNTKKDYTTQEYRNLKRKFEQLQEAPKAVRRFVGGISKPNRNALRLTPNSSILKTCPCENTLCKLAWEGLRPCHFR